MDKDFRFSFDPDLVKEVESWIRKSIHSFLMATYESMAYKLQGIVEDPKYFHSYAYFHTQLLLSLYNNFINIDCMNDVRELIDTGFFQDSYHLAVLYDLYGVSVYLMDRKVLKIQNKALHTALGYCYTSDSENLRGLILYHLILNNKIAGDFSSSLEYFEECENYLQKAGAYRRLMHAKLNKGNVYAEVHLYRLAEKIYQELENSYTQIEEKHIIPKNYESSSWCSLTQGKYAEALEYAQKAYEAGSKFPDIYIAFAYANYKLENYDTSKQAIGRFRKVLSHTPRIDFIDQFFVLLEKRIDQKPLPGYLIERLLKKLPDFRDVELEMVLYPFLTEYYQSIEDYKNASMIQSCWIKYLQFCSS